jgi:acetyl-CoA carboxylase/biotin carboxylase 1
MHLHPLAAADNLLALLLLSVTSIKRHCMLHLSMLLTPAVALQVYTSQMQLGGPRVMGENGVSHYVVNDDLEGVKVVLRWLSYCPPQLGAEPPLLPTSDPVDRPVAYEPAEHEKLDPRAAISGGWRGLMC